ncbi:MAG: hypothetical protein AAGK14_13155 [Verrucomicrobiota bacterium]
MHNLLLPLALLLALEAEAAEVEPEETVPAGYVAQILEPTGGRILRPEDWHYQERHRGKRYDWVIAQEDLEANKGRYQTGVRIQCFIDIEENTALTPKQFMLAEYQKVKAKADRVVRYCEEQEDGIFTRICLETIEGPYHILYSYFWMSSGGDLAVVTIAGAPKEEWDNHRETFDTMQSFELIDMRRFEDE